MRDGVGGKERARGGDDARAGPGGRDARLVHVGGRREEDDRHPLAHLLAHQADDRLRALVAPEVDVEHDDGEGLVRRRQRGEHGIDARHEMHLELHRRSVRQVRLICGTEELGYRRALNRIVLGAEHVELRSGPRFRLDEHLAEDCAPGIRRAMRSEPRYQPPDFAIAIAIWDRIAAERRRPARAQV